MHNAALYANNPALLFNKAKNKNFQFSIIFRTFALDIIK